jgi:hypothetical protein
MATIDYHTMILPQKKLFANSSLLRETRFRPRGRGSLGSPQLFLFVPV